MKILMIRLLLLLVFTAPVSRVNGEEENPAPKAGDNPAEHLPPWITRLTQFGERADWSLDGRKILFLAKTYGDVYEVEVATKIIRPVTHHYYHLGYTRALYLASGDILLSGPEAYDPKNPHISRAQCFLYVLDKGLKKPPVPLGTKCSEGPAVSRTRMHIAWTQVSAQYPDEMPKGASRMLEADIVYAGGAAKLANQRVIIESRECRSGHVGNSMLAQFYPPNSRAAFPPPAKFAKRISEYLRENKTPCAPALSAALVAA